MSAYLELTGKRALVTGGTKGVGQAVVVALREAGATVLTTARSRPEQNRSCGTVHRGGRLDCGRLRRGGSDGPRNRPGGIDILVHVVGGSAAPAGGFAVLDDREWHKALDQNLLAVFPGDRALLPSISTADRYGVIIHITSIQRQLPPPDATIAYAAAKAALSNYSKALSKEVSPKGVRVVRVSPGWVETDGAVGLVEEIARKNRIDYEGARRMVMELAWRDSIGRPAKPREVADLVAFLASSRCRVHYRHRIRDRRRHRADRLKRRLAHGRVDPH